MRFEMEKETEQDENILENKEKELWAWNLKVTLQTGFVNGNLETFGKGSMGEKEVWTEFRKGNSLDQTRLIIINTESQPASIHLPPRQIGFSVFWLISLYPLQKNLDHQGVSPQEVGSDEAVRRRGIGKRTAYPVQIPALPGMTPGGKEELGDQNFLEFFFLFVQKIFEQGFVEIVFLPIPAFHRAGG